MVQFTLQQQVQEDEYGFPYHYSDLIPGVFPNIEYLSTLHVIRDLLKPMRGQRILDVGCGDGRFCYELKNEGADITGIDYSEKALLFAKAFNPNVAFFQTDITVTCEFKNKFDKITLIEVLEHVPPQTIPQIRDNLYKLLDDEGFLLLSVPTINRPVSSKHYQHFTKDSICQTLSPLFEPVEFVGLAKGGKKRSYYFQIRRIGVLLFPLRNKGFFVNTILNYIESYYKNNLQYCSPEAALTLVVMFKKVKNNPHS